MNVEGIGVSRSDTSIVKRIILNYANILRFKEPVSQMSMVWRLESLLDVLGVVANGYGTCCCHLLSIWLILCYYSIYIAFYFELADDIYSVLVPCTDPYL